MTTPDLPTPDDLARLREAATRYGFDSLRLLFRAYDAVVAERDELRRMAHAALDDMTLCNHPGCMRFATRLAYEHPMGMFCADHLNDRGVRRDIHHLLPDTALDDLAAVLPAKETP